VRTNTCPVFRIGEGQLPELTQIRGLGLRTQCGPV
jgi:hypothetical protein